MKCKESESTVRSRCVDVGIYGERESLDHGTLNCIRYRREGRCANTSVQTKHFRSKQRRRTNSPELSDSLQDLHYNRALVHESMVSTFHDFDVTTIITHRFFHPPHGIFSNLLVPVAVPDLDFVRVVTVRETPGAVVMVENLQKVTVCPFRCFGVRRRN